jgi:hypothetical protein
MKISKSKMSSLVVLFEIIGCFFLITFLWFNEWLDLAHLLFGAPSTPHNHIENIMETAIVLILCFLMVWATRKLLARIRYLEGIIPICSYCKKVRVGSDWVPVDKYVRDHSSADFSHALCPHCLKEFYEKDED